MKPQSAAELKTSIQDIRGPVIKHEKRGPGRPRKVQEKKPSIHSKTRKKWSKKTISYIKTVTEGKGALCKIWSVHEKRRLLYGLKKYSHQDWDNLCKTVPTRTKEEIQEYIQYLKGAEQYKSKKDGNDIHFTWAPIESWLDMSSEMVHYEQADLSRVLSRVFSVIGQFDNFPKVNNTSEMVPDYGKLYGYIAAVMDESLTMPDLNPLESAVIADLMHSLGDVLRVSDTLLQRKVMCWKYKMLNYKFEFYNVEASLDRIRKALTNDFSDLQKDRNRGLSGLPSFTQTSSTTQHQTTVDKPLVSTQPCGAGEASQLQPGQCSQDTSASGIYGPGPSSEDPHSTSVQQDDSENEDKSRKGRGRRRIYNLRRAIEKPRLFTMNPFCVPIRLLRLKPLLQEAVSRNLDSKGLVVNSAGASSGRGVQHRSASVSSVPSDTSVHLSKQSDLDLQVDKDEVTNSIRQVTGLYVPRVVRKYKKKLKQKSAPVQQASATTISAISSALARRLQVKGAGASQPAANLTQDNEAICCVHLSESKMALVPLQMSHTTSLSHLPLNEAMPVPRQLPALTPSPAVEIYGDQLAGSSVVLPVGAASISTAWAVSMDQELAQCNQSSVVPEGSVTVANLPSSVAVCEQNSAPCMTANMIWSAAPPSSVMLSHSSASPQQPQESIQVKLALPSRMSAAPSEGREQGTSGQFRRPAQPAPSRKRPHSPEAFSVISFQQREDGTTVRQLAQIIPQKRKSFTKVGGHRVTTTEIIVAPPPGTRISSDSRRRRGPPRTRSPKSRKTKPSDCTDDGLSAAKKASAGKLMQSNAGLSSVGSDKTVDAAEGTVEAQDSQTAGKKKAPRHSRKAASKVKDGADAQSVHSSVPTEGAVEPSETGYSGTLSTNFSAQSNDSHRKPSACVASSSMEAGGRGKSSAAANSGVQKSAQEQNARQKTLTRTPADYRSAFQGSLSSKTGPQTATARNSNRVSGLHSLQVQPQSAAPTIEQSRTTKSTFKSIQAQVASSFHVPTSITKPGRSKPLASPSVSKSAHKSSPVTSTNSDPQVPSSSPSAVCSSSASSPTHSEKLKLTKSFLCVQRGQTTLSARGRKIAKERTDNSEGMVTELVTRKRAFGSSPQARTKDAGSGSTTAKGKKQAPKSLAEQDMSSMQVEIVTPEDMKSRLMASLGLTVDRRTQIWNKSAGHQSRTNVISFVMDKDEVSLVSI